MSKGGAHSIQQMAFSVGQDTRPPPPAWPAIALPANQDYVFVQLIIGCARIAHRERTQAQLCSIWRCGSSHLLGMCREAFGAHLLW